MNITVEQVLSVIAALVGVPALLALLIDILKWAGVVQDENAGKISAAFNLIALIVTAVLLQFFPKVDIATLDQALLEIVKFAALIFQYMIQITMTKAAHIFYKRTVIHRFRPERG